MFAEYSSEKKKPEQLTYGNQSDNTTASFETKICLVFKPTFLLNQDLFSLQNTQVTTRNKKSDCTSVHLCKNHDDGVGCDGVIFSICRILKNSTNNIKTG